MLQRVKVLAEQTIAQQFASERNPAGLTDPKDSEYTADCAIAYLFTGEHHYADRARQAVHKILNPWPRKDLSLANRSFMAAIVHQCCSEAWTPEEQQRFECLIARCAMGINQVRPGNPYQIGNNWWAVTHSGALVAALIAHDKDDGQGGTWNLSHIIARCTQRLSAFCKHFGDAGLYHEGLGYQTYACSNLIPALLALRNATGKDLFARNPNLIKMANSLNAIAAPRYNRTDEEMTDKATNWGTAISWNDAGHGWPGTAMGNALLALIPEETKGSHVAWYDRMHGHASPNQEFGAYCGGRFYAAVCYPYDIKPTEPGEHLPKHICDSRQGLWVVRNRYQDQDDAILGVYARTTHVGGHSHNDAGSIRLMALNHDWIIGGGQARAKAQWQSSVCDADEAMRKKSMNRGLIMWDEANDQEAHMAMDLRWNVLCYHERYVGVRWATEETPLTIARLDLLEHTGGRNWWWSQVFAPELQCDILEDGFILSATDGTTMNVTFIGLQPDELTLEQLPSSSRTYASGPTVEYPGRPFVRASFKGESELQHIYAVATIEKGNPSPIISSDQGLGIKIGVTEWSKPFGHSIPDQFTLGKSRNLCQFPSGTENWDFPMDHPGTAF